MPFKGKRGKYQMKRVVILQHAGNLMGMKPQLTKRATPKYYNYFLECGHCLEFLPNTRTRWIEYNLHRNGVKIYKNCPTCVKLAILTDEVK
uniref:Uncharacterized protein n=1 Tax=viral metagenome TaxID=1070528 RepID=A0A6M3XTG9_9ZZZZ